MKVFITGGAGFIGSHLADRLLARGDEVLVVDNYETGRRDNLSEHEKLKVIEGTITDVDLIGSLLNDFKPDLVIHAAASYKDPHNWVGDEMTNAVGTAIVVQAAQRAGCERLIYFQTAMCYGLKPLEQPITLQHPLLAGGSSYAISKTADRTRNLTQLFQCFLHLGRFQVGLDIKIKHHPLRGAGTQSN